MDAPPIPFSASDLERRRLEHTLDHDLSSLSLTASSSFVSSASSLSTLPVGRAAPAVRHFDHEFEYPRFGGGSGADDTPRASKQQRNAAISFARTDTSAGGGVSPASTAGHHVSAATLGAGVFRRPGNPIGRDMTGDEFDPDRSLGRLVGELAKAMDEDVSFAWCLLVWVADRCAHAAARPQARITICVPPNASLPFPCAIGPPQPFPHSQPQRPTSITTTLAYSVERIVGIAARCDNSSSCAASATTAPAGPCKPQRRPE